MQWFRAHQSKLVHFAFHTSTLFVWHYESPAYKKSNSLISGGHWRTNGNGLMCARFHFFVFSSVSTANHTSLWYWEMWRLYQGTGHSATPPSSKQSTKWSI